MNLRNRVCYTVNVYNVICGLYLNKARKIQISEYGDLHTHTVRKGEGRGREEKGGEGRKEGR